MQLWRFGRVGLPGHCEELPKQRRGNPFPLRCIRNLPTHVRRRTAPKAPLCKGSCQRPKPLTEGFYAASAIFHRVIARSCQSSDVAIRFPHCGACSSFDCTCGVPPHLQSSPAVRPPQEDFLRCCCAPPPGAVGTKRRRTSGRERSFGNEFPRG